MSQHQRSHSAYLPASDGQPKRRRRHKQPAPTGALEGVVWGTAETAQHLGVRVQNLGQVVGLPAPATRLACGNIYLANEIRAFKLKRDARLHEHDQVAA